MHRLPSALVLSGWHAQQTGRKLTLSAKELGAAPLILAPFAQIPLGDGRWCAYSPIQTNRNRLFTPHTQARP
eukprot:scaffold3392_cov131-Isochrysis_galbana.AAC.2